jgi:hypothetical protein
MGDPPVEVGAFHVKVIVEVVLESFDGALGAPGEVAATNGVGTDAKLWPTSLTAITLNEYVTEVTKFRAW